MALEVMRLSAIVDIGGGPGDVRLGPYRLLEQVGTGAYAAVYRSRHELMGVERALKVLRPPAAAWPQQRARFLREARIAAQLRHVNVVGVYDCGTGPDGTPYIVMEYVAGRSLACRLLEGVPTPAETVRVAGQLAAGLDHAHARGVVHRDVKPANVLLGADGAVRLGDFGIAHLGAEPDPAEPWAGLGTPAYMAPEQRLAERSGLGPHTDVYALAAVVYEMLTGRTPHGESCSGGAGEVAPPPPPRAVNPYLPAGVDQVLGRGLSTDPARRPPSAAALVAELAEALGQPAGPETPAAGPPHGSRWPAAPAGESATEGPPLPRQAPPGQAVTSGRLAGLIRGRRRA